MCISLPLGACMLFRTEHFKSKNLHLMKMIFLYFSDDDLCMIIKLEFINT